MRVAVRNLRAAKHFGFRRLLYYLARPWRHARARRAARAVRSPTRLELRKISWPAPIEPVYTSIDGARLTVQGYSVPMVPGPDWDDPAIPLLVRHHFHYLDWLPLIPSRSEVTSVLEVWLDRYGPENPIAWSPYVAATRALALVRFIEFASDVWPSTGHGAGAELLRHASYIAAAAEWDLDGNHLLREGVALVALAAVLPAPFARRAWRRGSRIIDRCLESQVLSDGGHVERSPWYHVLAVADLLQAVQAARACSALSTATRWQALTERMLAWLVYLRGAGGRLPLFKDSCEAAGAVADHVVGEARAIDIGDGVHGGGQLVGLRETGFYRVDIDDLSLALNFGPPGAYAMPAHSHADMLALEMWNSEGPIIVDQGVFSYAGATRPVSRGTVNHNTVAINLADQVELWGNFRVGRWTEPCEVVLSGDESSGQVSGWHDGYRTIRGSPRHHRMVSWDARARIRTIEIRDRVTVHALLPRSPRRQVYSICRSLRFADGWEVRAFGSRLSIRRRAFGFEVQADREWHVEPGEWWPGWGQTRPATLARLKCEAGLPWEGRMVIRWEV